MDAVSEIKQRLNVEDVVDGYVELKKAGRNFKAVCPFHSEKTPSFVVSPDKEIWHCFGCHRGGDMFDFVMQREGVDFVRALEILADKAGIDLSKYRTSDKDHQLKKRIKEILKIATKYYQVGFTKNENAQRYALVERGFNKEIVVRFNLGYAPNQSSGLVDSLKQKEYTEDEIAQSGIASKRNGQLFDFFRGRLIVPLSDAQGNPVGFTGRVLDDSLPKYINSPNTKLYNKSSHVFGLSQAKDAIRELDKAIVVEGNFDVLSTHQLAGRNVVAAAGTALTRDQLRQIGRFSKNMTLAFDADSAGIKATERAIPIASELDIELSIAILPEGKDPDDIVRDSAAKWRQVITDATYATDWLFEQLASEYDLSSPQGKKKFTDRFMNTLRGITDSVEQDHYVQRLSEATRVSPESIRTKAKQTKKTNRADLPPLPRELEDEEQVQDEKDEFHRTEQVLLSMALVFPETRISLEDFVENDFKEEKHQHIFKVIHNNHKQDFTDTLPESLHEIESYVKICMLQAEESYEQWSEADRTIEALSIAKRLRRLITQKRKQQISEQIRAAEAANNEDKVNELLQEYQLLMEERNYGKKQEQEKEHEEKD